MKASLKRMCSFNPPFSTLQQMKNNKKVKRFCNLGVICLLTCPSQSEEI